MQRQLSEQDWERIQEFIQTPTYDRQPEILVPESRTSPSDEET